MELIDKIKMSVKDLDLFYGDKQALKKNKYGYKRE